MICCVRSSGPKAATDATSLFKHIRDVPMLDRLIAGRLGAARSSRVLRDVLEERVLRILQAPDGAGGGLVCPWTPPLAARVMVAGLGAMLSWSVDTGMAASVEDMQSMFADRVARWT